MANNYLIEHNGKAFSPNGQVTPETSVGDHNRQVELAELEHLKTAPERIMLYVKPAGQRRVQFNRWQGRSGERNQSYGPYQVHTWLGTVLDPNAKVGKEVWSVLDFWTHRRHISCRIFGVLYHGWYMESSGDYCRLKKARRQS